MTRSMVHMTLLLNLINMHHNNSLTQLRMVSLNKLHSGETHDNTPATIMSSSEDA